VNRRLSSLLSNVISGNRRLLAPPVATGCIQPGAWGKSPRIVKVGYSEHECGALGGFPGKAHPRAVEGFKEGSMEGLEDND
jgi:hypothetical protein